MDYIILSLTILAIGIIGLVTKHDLIKMLISIEMMTAAATMNFVVFGSLMENSLGQPFMMLALSVDACVTAVALALAIVRGQVGVDQAVYNTVRKAALDGIPPLRLQVLGTLWNLYVNNGGNWSRTREIADRTRASYQTVKLELENLYLLNLVMKKTENRTQTAAQVWMPSRQMWEWVVTGDILASYANYTMRVYG